MTAAPGLAERQAAFMRAILDADAPLPDGWGAAHAVGLGIYRGNYRHALMEALASSFERTGKALGADDFRQARINHLIADPPSHWTIDACGAGFDETCARAFAPMPHIAELAWLEWAMLDCVGAPDAPPITPADFAEASARFGDAQWLSLILTFAPRAKAAEVAHDLAALWTSLDGEAAQLAPAVIAQRGGCLVWREGERATFVMVSAENACAFAAMQAGARYGDLIGLIAGDDPDDRTIAAAAGAAGQMLGLWLAHGLVTGFTAPSIA